MLNRKVPVVKPTLRHKYNKKTAQVHINKTINIQNKIWQGKAI
jgi:hypothetical protein